MKSIFNKMFLIALSIGFINLSLAGCRKTTQEVPDKLVYRLKWLFNISVVGDLWADVNGHFKENGLSVTVKPGGPEKDAIKELELGHAHFGVASADQVIRALSKGSPVVVLAQLFQANPMQWIYRPEKTRIESPRDLKGKVIGVTFGGNDETIMKALLAKFGIGKDEVELFSVRYDYTPFYQDEVDLWPVYRNAEGVVIAEKLRRAGVRIDFFNPDTAGIEFVANSVITTKDFMEQYSETVGKFMDALLTAWTQALDPANSNDAVGLVNKFDRDTPAGIIAQQLEVTRQMIYPSGGYVSVGERLGQIDLNAWKQTEKIMLDQNLIPQTVNIERRLYPEFAE